MTDFERELQETQNYINRIRAEILESDDTGFFNTPERRAFEEEWNKINDQILAEQQQGMINQQFHHQQFQHQLEQEAAAEAHRHAEQACMDATAECQRQAELANNIMMMNMMF